MVWTINCQFVKQASKIFRRHGKIYVDQTSLSSRVLISLTPCAASSVIIVCTRRRGWTRFLGQGTRISSDSCCATCSTYVWRKPSSRLAPHSCGYVKREQVVHPVSIVYIIDLLIRKGSLSLKTCTPSIKNRSSQAVWHIREQGKCLWLKSVLTFKGRPLQTGLLQSLIQCLNWINSPKNTR